VLKLSGVAAGAAAAGCCANMIGFAVASYRENKAGGLLAQGLGTSMLQVPNILRRPVIWLPAILSSAILGPISAAVLGMTNNAKGSGMGTAGLVGPLMAYQTMTQTQEPWIVIVQIVLMLFVAPALLAFGFSEAFRKLGWIRPGDMKLDL
jgi:Predicted membrane protein, putative toxin regulator